MKHFALPLACAIATVTPALHAQQATRVIRPDTRVEIQVGAENKRGTVVESTDSLLVLRTERGLDSLRLASISRWRWRGTHATKGATGGMMLGGVVLGVFGGLLSAGLCEVNCDGAGAKGALFGSAFGAVSGAGVGAILGSFVPRWNDEARRPVAVRESPLAGFPLKGYATIGNSNGGNEEVREMGLQFVRGNVRAGIEVAHLGLGSTMTPTFQGDPLDPRIRSLSELSRYSDHIGVVLERRIAGGLWATAGASQRTYREKEWRDDFGLIDDPQRQRIYTTSERTESGVGGSAGLVLRHRVAGDVWLHIAAKQHVGGPSPRGILTAGLEL